MSARSLRPAWEGVERAGERVLVRGIVPEDLVWLEGHFPGEPVVAGVVQLDWVLGLAREQLGLAEAPEAIEALKFRTPLLPGAAFEVRLEARPERLAFELRAAEGRVLSSGRVRWGSPPGQHEVADADREAAGSDSSRSGAPEPAGSEPGGSAEWPLRLPQTGRMRLLEEVVDHSPRATTARAVVREHTPLCRGGRVPAWLALEWLAQGMAAHGGLLGGAAPARGLLLGTRQLLLHTRSFGVGERLWIRVEPLRTGAGLVSFDCALGVGNAPRDADAARVRALARARLNAFLEGAARGGD